MYYKERSLYPNCPRKIKTLILNQKLQKQPFGDVSENQFLIFGIF